MRQRRMSWGELESARGFLAAPAPIALTWEVAECLNWLCVHGNIARRAFGRPTALPGPVGITLDTEPLKDWVR